LISSFSSHNKPNYPSNSNTISNNSKQPLQRGLQLQQQAIRQACLIL